MTELSGPEPPPSALRRCSTRFAWSRVSRRCRSSALRYEPRGVIAICSERTLTSVRSVAYASSRYCRTFVWEAVIGSCSLAAREALVGGLDDSGAVLVVALVALGLAGGLAVDGAELGGDGIDVLLVIAGPRLIAEQLRNTVGDRGSVAVLALVGVDEA